MIAFKKLCNWLDISYYNVAFLKKKKNIQQLQAHTSNESPCLHQWNNLHVQLQL